MARIKVTDTRQGRSFRTGVNGRFYDIPVNSEQEVDDGLLDHLTSLGVAFETIEGKSSKRASSSNEGSEGELAPIGDHDVRAPAMDARTLGDREAFGGIAGDQPGDMTASGGVAVSEGPTTRSIDDAAAIADAGVHAEINAGQHADVLISRLANANLGQAEPDLVPVTKAAKAPKKAAPKKAAKK